MGFCDIFGHTFDLGLLASPDVDGAEGVNESEDTDITAQYWNEQIIRFYL